MNEMDFIDALHTAISVACEQGLLVADVSFDGDNDSSEIIVSMGGKRVVISTEDVEDDDDVDFDTIVRQAKDRLNAHLSKGC